MQFTQATAVFDTLNHAARHSLKSSHHQYDDDQEFRASSFITDFVQVFPETDPTLSLKAFYGYLNYGNQQLTQTKDDSHIPVWPLPQAVGGHQVLSDQASCPFKAFARHRLNASPLSRFEIGISAAERGTALHHALDHLFDKLPTREALQALSHEECTSLCYDAADVAVGYLRRIKKALMTPTFSVLRKSVQPNCSSNSSAILMVRPDVFPTPSKKKRKNIIGHLKNYNSLSNSIAWTDSTISHWPSSTTRPENLLPAALACLQIDLKICKYRFTLQPCQA